MNEIRNNNDPEVEIVRLKFKIEPIVIILHALLCIVGALVIWGGVYFIVFTKVGFGMGIVFILLGAFTIAFNIVSPVLKIMGASKSEITISNQRIYGRYGPYLVKKTFSYRLDQLDNVETGEYFGAHTLVLNFQDGKGPRAGSSVYYGNSSTPMVGNGVFRIHSVENYKEAYEKLSKLLLSLKTNTNLKTDIEMEKVNAEERKADAFEKMANHMATTNNETKSDYIDEIKRLKELLDCEAITQEEYDREKKEILDHNHQD